VTAYTLGDVARICGVSRRRLRYWERTALVVSLPLDAQRGQTAFDFRGLVTVRTIAELVGRGLPLRRIRQSVAAVRERIPDCEALPSLRAWDACGRVVVRHDGVLMEPDGQLVLEWSPGAGVESLAANRSGERARQIALYWFERGCGLDADSETWEQAGEAYRRSVQADPSFADAHCNLGSVYFNQGRRALARECFERAVALVPGHLEANLNLGTLCEEDGADEAALRHYRTALAESPLYPDTHVSLALVYEKLGLPRTARSHWRRYLVLDAKGAWSELARRRLSDH
jgi:Tfp pilus assembly protein PilF